MATKPILDPATIARLKADLRAAQTGNILDRTVALERALAALIDALEVAK